MKKFRYRKVTPKILERMKELRELGLSYNQIAKEVNLTYTIVRYHLNPKYKEYAIKRAKAHHKGYSKETYQKRKEYQRKYLKERYHSDEEFRKRMIGYVLKYQKKLREKNE